MKAQSRLGTKSIRRLEMATQVVQVTWRGGKHAYHQVACVSSARPGTQHLRLRQQILELNEEFGWIVSRSVKRESLGKDAFEFAAVLRGFEANLACVKGKRETKGELKSLDTQL